MFDHFFTRNKKDKNVPMSSFSLQVKEKNKLITKENTGRCYIFLFGDFFKFFNFLLVSSSLCNYCGRREQIDNFWKEVEVRLHRCYTSTQGR